MSAEGALVEELKRLVLENATLKTQVADLQTRAILTDQAQAKGIAPVAPPNEVRRVVDTRFLVVEETVTYEELMGNNPTGGAHSISAVAERLARALLKSHAVQVMPSPDGHEYRVRVACYHWPENLPQMKALFG